jgi:hypothetical protein
MTAPIQQLSTDSRDVEFAEDSTRKSPEKETGIHLVGDETHLSITSYKRVVFEKLLQHPQFIVKSLHLLIEGEKQTVGSVESIETQKPITIIGAEGILPVGTLSIGAARQSNSHAEIVK